LIMSFSNNRQITINYEQQIEQLHSKVVSIDSNRQQQILHFNAKNDSLVVYLKLSYDCLSKLQQARTLRSSEINQLISQIENGQQRLQEFINNSNNINKSINSDSTNDSINY
jgi:hypothetical protein